jgi:hypothetical protein
LRLFVNAKHDCPLRRVEVKPHDIGDLSLEHRVVRDLEPMRQAWTTGRRGRQPVYSGEEDQKTVRGTVFPTNAVQTCLTMKVLFGMALRQTTGFVESLLCLIGLDWDVPDFSTLSRPLPGR